MDPAVDSLDKEKERIARKARLYEAIRRQIEHEDGLINQRFTWCLTSCAFLFAGYSLLISNNEKFASTLWVLPFILLIFCFIGVRSCILYDTAIGHAESSLAYLRDFWHSSFPEEDYITNSTQYNELPEKHYPHIHYCAEGKQQFRESTARGVINILKWIWIILAAFSCFTKAVFDPSNRGKVASILAPTPLLSSTVLPASSVASWQSDQSKPIREFRSVAARIILRA